MFKTSTISLVKQCCLHLEISAPRYSSIIQGTSSISDTHSTVKFALTFSDVRNNSEKKSSFKFYFSTGINCHQNYQSLCDFNRIAFY